MKKSVVIGNRIAPGKKALAKKFRKKPTAKEKEVWEWLRNRKMMGLKWRRQQIIDGFIADFYCPAHRLALELDGDVHLTEAVKGYDVDRNAAFAEKGIQTLRISNASCTKENLKRLIQNTLASTQDSPSPFMERGPGGEVL